MRFESLSREQLRARIVGEMERAEGCGDDLYALSFLLYRMGHCEDVFLLHDAKHLNFDTGCMLNSRLLTMGQERRVMLTFLDEKFAVDLELKARYRKLRHEIVEVYDHPDYETEEAFRQSVTSYFSND